MFIKRNMTSVSAQVSKGVTLCKECGKPFMMLKTASRSVSESGCPACCGTPLKIDPNHDNAENRQ